jgi:pimeloyl-ACP methyl ester carboxylesterase
MTLALRNPHSISALIPVDNSPVDATLKSDFSRYVQGMRVVEDAQVTKQSDADAILQKYEEALPIRQFLLTNLTRSPETNAVKFRIPIKTLASSLSHLGDFPFRDPDESRYEGPTLFVRGTKSHYVADEALPLIGRFFPRFELLDIESGHWVISEKPEEFRRGVVDFLQRQSSS